MSQITIKYGDITQELNENKTATLLTRDKQMLHNIEIDVPSLPTGDIIIVEELPKQADENKIYFYKDGYYKGKNKFVDIIVPMNESAEMGITDSVTYLSFMGGKGFEEILTKLLKKYNPEIETPSPLITVDTFEISSKAETNNIIISNPSIDDSGYLLQNLYLYYIHDEEEKVWYRTEEEWVALSTVINLTYKGNIYDFSEFSYATEEDKEYYYALFNVEWELINIPNVTSLPKNFLDFPNNCIHYKNNNNYYTLLNNLKDIYIVEQENEEPYSFFEQIIISSHLQILPLKYTMTIPQILLMLNYYCYASKGVMTIQIIYCFNSTIINVAFLNQYKRLDSILGIPYLNIIKDKSEITDLSTPGYYLQIPGFARLFQPKLVTTSLAGRINSNDTYSVKTYKNVFVDTPHIPVYGKYILDIDAIKNATANGTIYFDFTCNETKYHGISDSNFQGDISFINTENNSELVYDGEMYTWLIPYNEDYTIDLYVNPQSVTDTVYTMLNQTFEPLSTNLITEEQYFFTTNLEGNLNNYFFQTKGNTWNDWITSSNNPGTFFTKADSNSIFITIKGIEYQLENVATDTIIEHGKTYSIIATSV